MKKYTDKELLDFLQKQNDKSRSGGKCLFRISVVGRGWRLHETSREGAIKSVRRAIARGIEHPFSERL